MLTSPSFETEASFDGSISPAESISDMNEEEEEFDLHRPHDDDRWGIVSQSNDGSNDMHEEESPGPDGYVGPGFLILEGVESNASSGNGTTNLSIPGTDSLPTEIDTLSELNNAADTANLGHTVTFRKRSFFVSSVLLASLVTTGLGYLEWERRRLYASTVQLQEKFERLERDSALKLQQEIQRLEEEKQDIQESCSSFQPIWDETSPPDENPDEFTIVDNCWLKAKARVQFGPCGDDTRNTLSEFTTNAWHELRALWNSTSSTEKTAYLATVAGLGQGSSAQDTKEGFGSAGILFPGYVSDAFAAAGKKFTSQNMMDNTNSKKFDFEEAKASLTQASEAVSDAVLSVTEAMTSGIKDLSNDPVAHLAAALKSASHATSKKDPITMNGIFEAGKVFSSVMSETGDILSVKVTEMMDDPLSFFEFETDRK